MTDRPTLLTFRRACTVCALVLLAAVQAAVWRRAARRAATPADAALRALNAGQYDEVERLLRIGDRRAVGRDSRARRHRARPLRRS